MEVKSANLNIIYLNWKNRIHIDAVCNLHIELLPESVLSKLGYDFLFHFYYSKLVKEKLVEVYLYQLNNNFVGFVSVTNKPFHFMQDGFKKYFISLGILMSYLIVLNPNRIILIRSLKRESLKYKTSIDNFEKIYADSIGQFLSFGVLMTNDVLEYYRNSIDSIDDVGVSNVLFKHVSQHFKKNDKNFYFLMALKVNLKALKLYRKFGGVIIDECEANESVIIKYEI